MTRVFYVNILTSHELNYFSFFVFQGEARGGSYLVIRKVAITKWSLIQVS